MKDFLTLILKKSNEDEIDITLEKNIESTLIPEEKKKKVMTVIYLKKKI